MSRSLRIAAVTCLALMNFGCTFDYDIDLPNGYRLSRANSHEVVIVNSAQLVVVEGKIERFEQVGSLVFGYLDRPDWPNPAPAQVVGVQPGYFILDTAGGLVEKGLGEQEWRRKLALRGVARTNLRDVHHPWIPWLS